MNDLKEKEAGFMASVKKGRGLKANIGTMKDRSVSFQSHRPGTKVDFQKSGIPW